MSINGLERTGLSAQKINEKEQLVTNPNDESKKALLPLVATGNESQASVDNLTLISKGVAAESPPAGKKEHKKSVSYVVGLVNNGEADVGRMARAGYVGLLGYILNGLDKSKQEKALDYFSDELLLKMCLNGTLPKYLQGRVFERCTGKNANTSIAANIAKKAGASDLKLLMRSAKNETAKQLYEEALCSRFSDDYQKHGAVSTKKDKESIFMQKNFTLA